MKKRKDAKGRVLENGESQRKDGRYVFQYKDITGKRKCVYADNLSDLRKKKKQILRDIDDCIDTTSAEMTLNDLFDKQ